MDKIKLIQKVISIFLILCLVLAGNIKTVIGNSKKVTESELPGTCVYKVQERKIVISSKDGTISDTGWYSVGTINGTENEYDESQEYEDCEDVVQPGQSLGDEDVIITTCYYNKYTLQCPKYVDWKRTIIIEDYTSHVVADTGWKKIGDFKTCGTVATGTVGGPTTSKKKLKGYTKYVFLSTEKDGTNPAIPAGSMPPGVTFP